MLPLIADNEFFSMLSNLDIVDNELSNIYDDNFIAQITKRLLRGVIAVNPMPLEEPPGCCFNNLEDVLDFIYNWLKYWGYIITKKYTRRDRNSNINIINLQ